MLGRYALVREIARSNDIVWEATDPQMNRRLALKELSLPPTLAGQAKRQRIERFFREARAAGAMSHENIVTIYEVGEDKGRYFIAMEYLEGQTLRERLQAAGALPISEALGVAGALAGALEYAHARGVIHRDIKPDNVHLLPGGRVKLTDFGIARITHEDSLTLDGQVFGTPSYMSPEQVVGREIDARSDIFALGILLYEMISGRKPFTQAGDSVVTITYRIMNDPPPPLAAVPPLIDAVIQRALAKAPRDRWASITDFRAALERAARGALVTPAAPTLTGVTPPLFAPFVSPVGDATSLYSSRTEMNMAPGLAAPPPPAQPSPWRPGAPLAPTGGVAAPDALAYRPATAGPSARRALSTLISLLFLAGIVGGGVWALREAYANQRREAQRAADNDVYIGAVKQYKRDRFEEAGRAFKKLRTSADVDPSLKQKATLGELYCYRKIGARYLQQHDLESAERWFAEALRLVPADGQARQELEGVRRARGLPPLTNDAAAPPSAVPTVVPPAPSSMPAPQGTLPATANDFLAGNAQAAARAQILLDQGEAAWRGGDKERAVTLWNQAAQAGPGSPAANQALQWITNYNAGNPPFP